MCKEGLTLFFFFCATGNVHAKVDLWDIRITQCLCAKRFELVLGENCACVQGASDSLWFCGLMQITHVQGDAPVLVCKEPLTLYIYAFYGLLAQMCLCARVFELVQGETYAYVQGASDSLHLKIALRARG